MHYWVQIVPLLGPFSSAFSSIESQLLEVRFGHPLFISMIRENEKQCSLFEVEERVSALERARGFTQGDDSNSLNSGLLAKLPFHVIQHGTLQCRLLHQNGTFGTKGCLRPPNPQFF